MGVRYRIFLWLRNGTVFVSDVQGGGRRAFGTGCYFSRSRPSFLLRKTPIQIRGENDPADAPSGHKGARRRLFCGVCVVGFTGNPDWRALGAMSF